MGVAAAILQIGAERVGKSRVRIHAGQLRILSTVLFVSDGHIIASISWATMAFVLHVSDRYVRRSLALLGHVVGRIERITLESNEHASNQLDSIPWQTLPTSLSK